jgi:hypothetical protein
VLPEIDHVATLSLDVGDIWPAPLRVRAISFVFAVSGRMQNCIRQYQPFGGHLAQNSAPIVVFCRGRHFQTVRCVASVFFMLFAFESCHVSCPYSRRPRCVPILNVTSYVGQSGQN